MSPPIPAAPARIPGKGAMLHAVILRETRVRFGHKKLGYLWALLEPALHILTLSLIFTLLQRASPVEEGMTAFFATGVIPWLLFTNTAGRVMNAASANQALLIYPHVYPLDFMAGRMILESVTYLLMTGGLLLLLALIGQPLAVKEPLSFLLAWGCITLLGGGVGMVNAAIVTYIASYDHLYTTLQRALYFLSGVFFLMNDLPPELREALAWNPLLHAIDWLRATVLMSYESEAASPGYVALLAVGLLLAGMLAERAARREMRNVS